MLPFELHVPTTLDEALGLLDQHGDEARPIAGGTALTLLMQQRLVLPSHLVSLSHIPELTKTDAANGTLRIGAGVTHRSVEKNSDVRSGWPLLAETYHRVATVRTVSVGKRAPNRRCPPSVWCARFPGPCN